MNNDNFVWTDELILEFVRWTTTASPTFQGRYADLEQFKKSKSIPNKEYEILSFKQNTGISDLWTEFNCGWCRNNNGKPITNPYEFDEIISNKLYKIHSVKRLRDGEIFTIGDKVSFIFSGREYKFIIKEIEEHNLSISVIGSGNDGYPFNIDLIVVKKVEDKKPILTENNNCIICGSLMVVIRGRYPKDSPRVVCPTCTTERLEQIQEWSNPDFGKSYQNKQLINKD